MRAFVSVEEAIAVYIVTLFPDARALATIGLGLDIIGVLLLFRYGAIGGMWIHEGREDLVQPQDPYYTTVKGMLSRLAPVLRAKWNEVRATIGATIGLGCMVLGFLLQAVAQWV